MRVYLPSTFAGLRGLQRTGEIGPAPLHGHAVTGRLRESYAVGDTEELEYVAQLAASSDSISLLRDDPDVPRRRVVLAADVPDETVEIAQNGDESSVTVSVVVPLSSVQSILVDDPDVSLVIERAAESWLEAQSGDDDALFDLDEACSQELMWFVPHELDELLS